MNRISTHLKTVFGNPARLWKEIGALTSSPSIHIQKCLTLKHTHAMNQIPLEESKSDSTYESTSSMLSNATLSAFGHEIIAR